MKPQYNYRLRLRTGKFVTGTMDGIDLFDVERKVAEAYPEYEVGSIYVEENNSVSKIMAEGILRLVGVIVCGVVLVGIISFVNLGENGYIRVSQTHDYHLRAIKSGF
jgi:hypothetical protein